MDTPEPQPAVPLRAQALIRGAFQSGGRRSALIVVLFAVLVVTTRGADPQAGAETGVQPAAAEHASTLLPNLAATVPVNRSPEATALDNLLSRFDVLIRLLEARGVQSGQDTRALAELRVLRKTVYDTSRRALSEADSSHAAPR